MCFVLLAGRSTRARSRSTQFHYPPGRWRRRRHPGEKAPAPAPPIRGDAALAPIRDPSPLCQRGTKPAWSLIGLMTTLLRQTTTWVAKLVRGGETTLRARASLGPLAIRWSLPAGGRTSTECRLRTVPDGLHGWKSSLLWAFWQTGVMSCQSVRGKPSVKAQISEHEGARTVVRRSSRASGRGVAPPRERTLCAALKRVSGRLIPVFQPEASSTRTCAVAACPSWRPLARIFGGRVLPAHPS